jgi:hypothetical protein
MTDPKFLNVQEDRQIRHTHTVYFEFDDGERFTLDPRHDREPGATYRPTTLMISYTWYEDKPLNRYDADGKAQLRAVRIRKDGSEGAGRHWDYGLPTAYHELIKRLGKAHRPADMPDPKERS